MNRHLRKLIRKYRSTFGLNFAQLAKMAGYKNKIKWANRICNFEREGVGEDDMVRRIIDALHIDAGELRQAVQEDESEWRSWADEPVSIQMRVMLFGAIILNHDLPENITTKELAIEYACQFAKANQLRVCLALSRRESVWISRDGQMSVVQTKPGMPNSPYASIGGKKFVLTLSNEGLTTMSLRN